MEKLKLLAYILFLVPGLILAQTRTITSTGNWDNTGSWSGGNIANDVSHNVVYGVGGAKTITIRDGFSYTVGNYDIDNDALTINSGGSLNIGNSTNSRNLTGANGATITVAGTLIIWGDLIVNNNLNWDITGTVIIKGNVQMNNGASLNVTGSGSLGVDGNFTGGNNTTITTGGSGTINVGGDFTLGGGTTSVSGPAGSISVGGDCNASAAICGSSTLPVELLYFNSKLNGNKVTLNWATASELDFDFFEIQRSANAEDFYTVNIVPGKGSPQQGAVYDLIDHNPMVGRSYYRLKAVDLDGTYEYFGMQRVDYDGSKGIAIFPNPLSGNTLNIHTNFTLNKSARIQVINNLGKVVYQSNEVSMMNSIDVSDVLGKGIYIVRFIDENEVHTSRLIVK